MNVLVGDFKYYTIGLLSGAFALVPYSLLFLGIEFPKELNILQNIQVQFVVFFLFSILIGLLFLDFAVYVETYIDEKLSKKITKEFVSNEIINSKKNLHESIWNAYLLQKFESETGQIMHKIIQYLVQRLTFLLTFIIALPFFTVGLFLLLYKCFILSISDYALILILSGFLFKLCWDRANYNAQNLSILRYILVNDIQFDKHGLDPIKDPSNQQLANDFHWVKIKKRKVKKVELIQIN